MFDMLLNDTTISKCGKPMDKIILKKWPKCLSYQTANMCNPLKVI